MILSTNKILEIHMTGGISLHFACNQFKENPGQNSKHDTVSHRIGERHHDHGKKPLTTSAISPSKSIFLIQSIIKRPTQTKAGAVAKMESPGRLARTTRLQKEDGCRHRSQSSPASACYTGAGFNIACDSRGSQCSACNGATGIS